MKNLRKFLSLALIFSLALFLAACGGGDKKQDENKADSSKDEKQAEQKAENKDTLYIGACIHSTDNEYWNQEAEGVKMFADTLPEGTAKVEVLTCDGEDEKQLNGIKAFIASHGKNCIFYVDPSNAPNTAAIAEVCEDAGVYWTSVWHLAEGLNPNDYKYYVAHQSVDGVKQGYDIAKEMFSKFKTPGKGKILALQGQLGNDSAVERYEGLNKALSENPDIELLDTQVANWNSQEALKVTETWLAKYGNDIDGIWCANDGMALGALQALKAKGLNGTVKLCGVDGVSAALDAIEAGDLVCTVANNGYLQGGYGASYAYQVYSGKVKLDELKNRLFYTEGYFVNADNLKEYKEKFVDSTPEYDFNNLDFAVARPMELKK